jgi:hypothetical protein
VCQEQGGELLEFRARSRFDTKIPDGTPQFWDRLATVRNKSLVLWATQQPPVRLIDEKVPLEERGKFSRNMRAPRFARCVGLVLFSLISPA